MAPGSCLGTTDDGAGNGSHLSYGGKRPFSATGGNADNTAFVAYPKARIIGGVRYKQTEPSPGNTEV